MRQLKIVITLAVGVLMAASFANAGPGLTRSLYDYEISKKIVKCERLAELSNSKCRCVKIYAERKSSQAEFYMQSREELIREMIEKDVGTKSHQVEHFLITAYFQRAENGQK